MKAGFKRLSEIKTIEKVTVKISPHPIALGRPLLACGLTLLCFHLFSGSARAALPACDPVPSGIVYWWLGDDNPNDIVGGNTAILEGGVTYTTGNDGLPLSAFNFDGSTGFLATSDLINNAPQTFTLECWFKTTSSGGPGGVLIGFSGSQTQTGVGEQYDRIVYMGDNGFLHFGIWPAWADSTTFYNDGNWHHVAATMSASDGIILYVDGAQVAQNTSATIAAKYKGWWRIGQDNLNNWPNAPASLFFKGAIDQVSIYNRELSAAEILAIYNAGGLGKCVPSSTAAQLVFTTSPVTVTAGVASSTITVQRQDQSGNPVTSEANRTVTLSSTSSGTVTFNPPSLTIASGSSSASFTYTDTQAGTQTITAASTSPTTITSATQQETVKPGPAEYLISYPPINTPVNGQYPIIATGFTITQTIGVPFSFTVEAEDSDFNIVPVNDMVELSSTDPDAMYQPAPNAAYQALQGADVQLAGGVATFNVKFETIGTTGSQTLDVSDVPETLETIDLGPIPVIGGATLPTPSFSDLTSQSITYGTTAITLAGTVSAAGPLYPAQGETITVTINGYAQTTTINDSTGDFSFSYILGPLPVTAYTINYAYAGDASLSAANDSSTTLTVNQATPSITTPPTAAPITYGQALSASTLSGGVVVNPVSGLISVSGTFAFTTPSTGPTAGTASQSVTFTPTGPNAGDYKTASTTVSVTVNQALLTISANNAYMVVGGPVPALTLNYNGFVFSDGPSSLGGAASETVTPPVTSQSPTGNYPINVTMGTISNPNYSYVFNSGTLQILPQVANATGGWTIYEEDGGYPYTSGGDGDTIPFDVTLSASWDGSPSFTDYNGSVTGNAYLTLGGNLSLGVSIAHTGGWSCFSESYAAYNFEVIGPPGPMVPVILTANASTAASSAAGGSATASIYIVNTATSQEVPGSSFTCAAGNGSAGLQSTFSVNQDVDVPAGVVMQMVMNVIAGGNGSASMDPAVTIDPSFPQANEYTFASSPNSVPPPPGITITWPTPADITYGAALTADQLNASVNIDGSYSYSPPLGTVLQAGLAQPLTLTFTPSDTTDYPTPVTQIVPINVDPASLTITANPASMTAGGTVPTLTASYSGFVNGDTQSSLTTPPNTPPALSINGANTSVPGSYTITVSGASDPNYNISYVDGTLTVLAAAVAPTLTITRVGNSVTISWPDTAGYNLQENSNLAALAGWTASGYAVSASNGTNSITITPTTGTLFFRLTSNP